QCARHAMTIGRLREAADSLVRAAELPIASAEKIGFRRDAIVIAEAALESELVLSIAAGLRDLGDRRDHDDVELAELTTIVRSMRAEDDSLRRLLECVECRDAGNE